jgi:hypothetical protein
MSIFRKTKENGVVRKNELYDLDKDKGSDQENSLTYTVLNAKN